MSDTITAADLEQHRLWLITDGKDGKRLERPGASLVSANLTRADLAGANLYRANLTRADLTRANLAGADLAGANLYGASGLNFQIPQTGPLWVYKKLRGGVVKLCIPADAQRTANPTSRKCRAEYAVMLDAMGVTDGRSKHDSGFVYPLTPGAVIRPDGYDPDWRVECSKGIHFFLTEEEARDW